MKPRLLGRILFCLLVAVLLAGIAVLAWFDHWRKGQIATLAAGSQMMTTDLGAVELAQRGEGPAVLVFHGASGGYDQALLYGEALAGPGFQIIAPSRPGYLRTPIGSGLLPTQEADLMAALLDKLGVQKVAVIAVSTGGPAAIEFVLRHPDRAWALVLFSAVNKIYDREKDHDRPQTGSVVWNAVQGDFGSWLVAMKMSSQPREILKDVVAATATGDFEAQAKMVDETFNDPGRRAWLHQLMDTLSPVESRELGSENDRFNELFLPAYRFSEIAVPTLIVHGTLDRLVPFADAQAISYVVPAAKILPVEGAGHLILLSPAGLPAQQAVIDFLRQNRPQP